MSPLEQKLTLVGETARGYSIYRTDNGVGGHQYWSDEIGGGVIVWDTSLVSENSLYAALTLEEVRVEEEKNERP